MSSEPHDHNSMAMAVIKAAFAAQTPSVPLQRPLQTTRGPGSDAEVATEAMLLAAVTPARQHCLLLPPPARHGGSVPANTSHLCIYLLIDGACDDMGALLPLLAGQWATAHSHLHRLVCKAECLQLLLCRRCDIMSAGYTM